MPICSRCDREINGGRIALPKGKGVETVCLPCYKKPRLDVQAGAVLIDKDGKEVPIDAIVRAPREP